MTEDLSEYPDFGEEEILPWERGYQPIAIVPFPNMRCFGKPLQSLTSPQLLAVRREAERRNGTRGDYFAPLVTKVDEILTARGGE